MTFIHADDSFVEISVIKEIVEADIEVSQKPKAELIDNTFSITISEKMWEADPIQLGHHIYVPGTEWGGPVTCIKHDTGEETVTLEGPTWRGLLFQRRIEPPAGSGYLEISNVDANTAISTAIGSMYGRLMVVSSEPAGVNVSAAWRYQTCAGGLHATLRAYGLRLSVIFDNVNAVVRLSAEPVDDLSDVIEISQDYGISFTSVSGNTEFANHCLALGSGELEDRMVLNVYKYEGQYYTTRPSGIAYDEIRTVLLDYPNAEDTTELMTSAINQLDSRSSVQSISIDEVTADISAELGDIIGVRDRVTGMSAESEISKKIFTIKNGVPQIDMEVG